MGRMRMFKENVLHILTILPDFFFNKLKKKRWYMTIEKEQLFILSYATNAAWQGMYVGEDF